MKRGGNKRGKEEFFIRDKKGFELSINAVVIIVLAVILLVALVVILNRQTGFFSDFLNNVFSKTNVDNLVTSCNSFISQNSIYEYCCVEKQVKYKQEEKIVEEELTCQELAEKSFVAGRINKISCENVCET